MRTIKGYQSSIWSLAFDPSGRRIAGASWDQTVKVWDVEQPQDAQVFPGAGGYSSCFTPDGKFLATATESRNTISIIEVGTDKPPFIIPDYEVGDPMVTISPDGATMACAGVDNIVTLWQTGTWKLLGKLQGYRKKIASIAFSPDSQSLASYGDDLTVRLWDVAERRQKAVFLPALTTGGQVYFTRDGRTIIVNGTGRVIFLDLINGKEQKRVEGVSDCLALSPDGRWLAASVGLDVELLNVQTSEVKWRTRAHGAEFWGASFSPDGKTLATASWDGTAKLWNVASGQEMFTYRASGVVWNVAFSPDGKWLDLGSGSADQSKMALFRAATPAEVQDLEIPPVIQVQPANQTAAEGGAATLGVSVSSAAPVTYQWRKGTHRLDGQTDSTLRFTHLSPLDAGQYDVVVSGPAGSTTSSNANLTVIPVRDGPIEEINFQDKQPALYSGWAGSENPVTLRTNISLRNR